MLREFALVALGGALGSISRYGVTLLAARLFGKEFPWGTLLVNVAGCFAIGIVLRLIAQLTAAGAENRSLELLLHRAVAVGFLGGLTTFSTFSADTVLALERGQLGLAALNVSLNLLLCLAAVWCGGALLAPAGVPKV